MVKCLEKGLEASGAKSTNFGLKTTPMLHYLVRCINTAGTSDAYGEPTEEGYYKKLTAAFATAVVSNYKKDKREKEGNSKQKLYK